MPLVRAESDCRSIQPCYLERGPSLVTADLAEAAEIGEDVPVCLVGKKLHVYLQPAKRLKEPHLRGDGDDDVGFQGNDALDVYARVIGDDWNAAYGRDAFVPRRDTDDLVQRADRDEIFDK